MRLKMTKKTIKTYDMFDTLFARKCVDPDIIFKDAATQCGYEPDDFVAIRKQAEKDLYGSFFTFDDIYKNILDNYIKDEDLVSDLKDAEILMEEINLIPISENLSLLKPNDIVLSDMYLSQSFLKRFLPKFVNVIVTPNGKADGYVYGEIQKRFNIKSHTGDNTHSDIKMAEQNGIEANLVINSQRTPNEEELANSGYVKLSNICRKMRLLLTDDDINKKSLQYMEANINFPLLILMYQEIKDLCEYKGINNILISGRDGEKLHKICQILDSDNMGNYKYFYSSRMSRKISSDDYLTYVKNEVNMERTLIVDLDGTGWTLRNLKFKMESFDKKTADYINLYLFHYLDEANLPGFMPRPYSVPDYEISSTFHTNKFMHNRLELLNLTNHPMVRDVMYISNNLVIDFYDNGHNDETLEYVNIMDEAFLNLLPDLWDWDLISEIQSVDQEDRVKVMDSIYSSLSDMDNSVFDILERQQREEEQSIEVELKN